MRCFMLVVVMQLAVQALAGEPGHDKPDPWAEHLQAIDADLLKGDWPRAESSLDALQKRALATVVDGPGEAKLFGMTTMLRAVARAGQGDRDGAEYWWHVAQQLWPEAAAFDLARFGDVGLAVSDLGAPGTGARHDGTAEGTFTLTTGEVVPRDEMTAPVIVERIAPDFPLAKLRSLDREPPHETVVEVAIDAAGRLVSPRILATGPEPGFTFGSLEALSRWRYRPATWKGEARAIYLLTRLRYGPGLAHDPGRPGDSRASAPVASSSPGATAAVEISGAIVPPVLIRHVPPVHSRRARDGEVVARGVVDEQGQVTQLEVVQSQDPATDEAVLRALAKWRYRPATLDGKPQAVKMVFRVKRNRDVPAPAAPPGSRGQ